jgi:DNA-binding transcriptional regulator YdaS (Cro superfamily)
MSDDRRVALIRGINVGRAKRVAMSELRALVEGLVRQWAEQVWHAWSAHHAIARALAGEVISEK